MIWRVRTIRRFIHSLFAPRSAAIAAAFLLLALVGIADYVTGFSLSFSVFYLLPIIVAGWRVGRSYACCIAVLSVLTLNASDLLAGQRVESGLLFIWNVLIQLFFYLIVIWLLMRWKSHHETLEAGVRERTRDLTAEIAAREQLERKILTISEREQRRIGCDLHDVLCQHLAATALAAKVLEERIAAPAAVEAGHVVRMIENRHDHCPRNGTRAHTRSLGQRQSRVALEELAAKTREHFGVECVLSVWRCAALSRRFSSHSPLSYCSGGDQQRDPPRESRSPHRDALPSRRPGHPHRAG